MKTEIETINAAPSKRIYYSIIADYDLIRALCELIDNAIDILLLSSKKLEIDVDVVLNYDQQCIQVKDNCGGIKREELNNIVSPGSTNNPMNAATIGIFGVGSKRAVVALAQEIKIKTRFKSENTYQVDIDDEWLKADDWFLPVYTTDNIQENTTIIELTKLRFRLEEHNEEHIKEQLSAIYAYFIKSKDITIHVNSEKIQPSYFENWAFPPEFVPRKYIHKISSDEGGNVDVKIIAGLTNESSPAKGEYGVYIYCNKRLITRALKTIEVGFANGLAGAPHPKISLTRVIVFLEGEAKLMPWNSSKSGVNFNHSTFIVIQKWITGIVSDFAKLSRIWTGEWEEKVFAYEEGEIKTIKVDNIEEAKNAYLPPFPKSKPRYKDIIASKNKHIAEKKPWTEGLYEGVIAAELISKQKMTQKNRIALIVLDSTLEIAFKEYLVNDTGKYYNDEKLFNIFKQRHLVHQEIKKHMSKISDTVWQKINFYYKLRCELIHKRASIAISDVQIQRYRKIVEDILKKMYNLKFNVNK